MTIKEMIERKRELGLSNEELARRSGIPLGTLQKIFSGKTLSPRHQTIEAIEKVLRPEPKPFSYSYSMPPMSSRVQEAAHAYGIPQKKQGEYTVEDYYRIPDERRVELIDGVIYDMSAPSLLHQAILGQLYLQFQACADAHGESCDVYLSPCDVQLDNDNKTMLQPDLFVICRDYDRKARALSGAPDLTVEILSPSTRSKDMLLKLSKYHNAGVREYWLIDPENKKVYVYDFSRENFAPETYPFDSVIPICISGGECSVDFGKINRKLISRGLLPG